MYTPFDADGELALEKVPAYADRLAAWGCPGVFVGGTAGEGASLTVAERQALAEAWVEAARGRMDVQVHVGHTSLGDARNLAAHAETLGVRAISSVAPYFYRPTGVPALTDFLAHIAEAAPSVPFTYYHIPSVTEVHLPGSQVFADAAQRISTFAGIKYAHGDLVDLQKCLHLAKGKYEIFLGAAKLALPAMELGVRAAIGSVYNFTAPVFLGMLEHVERGDMQEARAAQLLAVNVIETVSKFGGELAGGKAMTNLLGIDVGPCRLPFVSPDTSGSEAMRRAVDRLGFFEDLETAGRPR